jgi:hypothetical protein
MGTEFLNRSKKTIDKRIDMQRAALATPDLFTVRPGTRPRSYVASIIGGANVSGGESLIAEVWGRSVKLRRGNSVVISLDNPTDEVIAAIENSGGAANGIVGRVHRFSGKADVTLC